MGLCNLDISFKWSEMHISPFELVCGPHFFHHSKWPSVHPLHPSLKLVCTPTSSTIRTGMNTNFLHHSDWPVPPPLKLVSTPTSCTIQTGLHSHFLHHSKWSALPPPPLFKMASTTTWSALKLVSTPTSSTIQNGLHALLLHYSK